MARLIHLNGPPGIGKSTLARRYADEHPGVLLCDIDVIRTMISGWRTDAEAAGRSRSAALAMIAAHLATGGDVVLPQLVARPVQLARFTSAAEDAHAEHVHVILLADPDVVVKRFRDRARDSSDELSAHATQSWDGWGGDDAIRQTTAQLRSMAGRHVTSTDLDETYAALLTVVRRARD